MSKYINVLTAWEKESGDSSVYPLERTASRICVLLFSDLNGRSAVTKELLKQLLEALVSDGLAEFGNGVGISIVEGGRLPARSKVLASVNIIRYGTSLFGVKVTRDRDGGQVSLRYYEVHRNDPMRHRS